MSLPNISVENVKLSLRSVLGRSLNRIRSISPGPVQVGPAICQVFIGGHGKKTIYTLINFPSLFSPKSPTACSYKLELYNQDGKEVASRRVTVPAFGTVEVIPEDVFGVPLPKMGLLSAQIVSGSRLSYADRHLGPIRAHFYAMYHDGNMRSMAIVHPQSALWAKAQKPESWRSSLIIQPSKLKMIELYQINPTPAAAFTEISLSSLDGVRLASSVAHMPARGVRRILWDAANYAGCENIVVASEGLTASNAKPLLFQHHAAGFSASHS